MLRNDVVHHLSSIVDDIIHQILNGTWYGLSVLSFFLFFFSLYFIFLVICDHHEVFSAYEVVLSYHIVLMSDIIVITSNTAIALLFFLWCRITLNN